MEVSYMTDHQYDSILEMVVMLMDGCKNLEEAKKKVRKLQTTGRTEKNGAEKGDSED